MFVGMGGNRVTTVDSACNWVSWHPQCNPQQGLEIGFGHITNLFQMVGASTAAVEGVQGYLAHKKTRTPLGPS